MAARQRRNGGTMYIEFDCAQCGNHVRKQQAKGMQHRFCSQRCKSEWQLTQKPVDRNWLYQKYVVEGLNCTQISKLVNRNSKRVWEWLQEYGIETRKRGTTHNGDNTRSMLGKHHSIETREKLRQARLLDGHVPYRLKDGTHAMKGRVGSAHPSWKHGATPERQSVYGSVEWKVAVKSVWKRDNATCQRCGLHRSQGRRLNVSFDIHHIVHFGVVELRCEVSNLILLCERCHYWVHSSENVNKEFIK